MFGQWSALKNFEQQPKRKAVPHEPPFCLWIVTYTSLNKHLLCKLCGVDCAYPSQEPGRLQLC